MERNIVMNEEVIWEGRFLRSIKINYKDSSGELREWEAFGRVNCSGIVAIVPVTEDGRAILIRQFRPAVNGYVIEFPAGLNDKNENLETAASRELLEETGYEAGQMIYLAEGPLSSGASKEILTVYLAKGLEFKGIGQRDETEDIEVLEIPIDSIYEQLAALEKEGNLIDLKIFGLIEMAKRHYGNH